MKTLSRLFIGATVAVLPFAILAQGGIGGNQNGSGRGGNPPPPARQFVSSLALPGYDFQLIEISGQPVQLRVDTSNATTGSGANSNALGFVATFILDNRTDADRTIQFPADYYANLRVGFYVLDSDGNTVWQSYQTLVDIPPLTPPTTLTLTNHTAWKNQVFVPIYSQGAAVLGPGDYTLQAEILGSPAYSSTTPFTVDVLVGGPLIPLTPAVKK